MSQQDIIFNFTLVLFSISFSWTVTERINKFPKIRRFNSIYYFVKFSVFGSSHDDWRRILSDVFVLVSSWSVVVFSLLLSIEAFISYYKTYYSVTIYGVITNKFVTPLLFFIIPQYMSRLISSIVLWLGEEEVKYMWENDRSQFDIFSQSWKDKYGLTEEGIYDGKIHSRCRKRTIGSLICISACYLVIFVV